MIPLWKQVLQKCGYPLEVVVLDFEAFFDFDYKMGRAADDLSTIEYVTHRKFEVLGCGFLRVSDNFPDYENQTIFVQGDANVLAYIKWLQSEYGENLERCTIVIQNAVFDLTILAKHFLIHPPHVVDILGLARHWHSRSNNDLEALCKRHNLPAKGDTDQFKGVTLRQRFRIPRGRGKAKYPEQLPLATDAQLAALALYGRNDVMREWEVFTILLPKLSNPGTELLLMQHTLELFTKSRLRVDYAKGEEIISLMDAEIDKTLEKVLVPEWDEDTQDHRWVPPTRKLISGDKSFAALLDGALSNAGDSLMQYMKVGKTEMLLAIAKDDPERELLTNHSDEIVRNLMSARQAVDSWPLHIARVRRIMAQAKANGGLLPVPLKFCGAHTGRWSGGERINLQNLGARGHALISAIRLMLVAVDGDLLSVADAAQIEARFLAWIAGQDDLCAAFIEQDLHPERPYDVYTKFASKVLNRLIRKAAKKGTLGYIGVVEALHKWARDAIGKVGVLGCGYGMGADKCEGYAKGQIDAATANSIVKTYRKENDKIVKFWGDIERAFIYTARYHAPCDLPRGLKFYSTDDCDVIIQLPNGRELKYHQVQIDIGKYDKPVAKIYNSQEHTWEHTWGGSLTENVVQAMSRDCLAEALLRTEQRGHHIAHHCHDELIGVGPADQAAAALDVLIAELARRPVWAPDCPLAAEGWVGERYGKQ